MFGGQQDVLAAYDAGGGNFGKVRKQQERRTMCCIVT